MTLEGRVVTSQDFINEEIVEDKIEMFESDDTHVVVLPVIWSGLKNEDDEDLYILIDGHHRREAAERCDIAVEYEIVDDIYMCSEPGEDRFNAWHMGGDWRYIDTECFVF